jgi:hypothetical protein
MGSLVSIVHVVSEKKRFDTFSGSLECPLYTGLTVHAYLSEALLISYSYTSAQNRYIFCGRPIKNKIGGHQEFQINNSLMMKQSMEQTTQKYIEFIYTCICKMIRNSGLTQ